jgi:hypothetical protein
MDGIQRAEHGGRGQGGSFVQERAVEVDLINPSQGPASVADGMSASAGYGPDHFCTGQGTGHPTVTSMTAQVLA